MPKKTTKWQKINSIKNYEFKKSFFRLAFEVVQIPPQIIEGILSVLSAVLWLGNLKFADTDHEDATLDPQDAELIENISKLLGKTV